MKINVYHHHPDLERELKRINESLSNITHQNLIIMSLTEDLKTEVAGLKDDVAEIGTAINDEQLQVKEVLTKQDETIKKLEDLIAAGGGGNETELQAILDDVKSARATLKTASDDLKSTIPDVIEEPEEEEPE